MTTARTILVRLGLLVIVLAAVIGMAVPFSAPDDVGLSERCGTTFFKTERSSNIFLDPVLRENCDSARQPWRLAVLFTGGLGVVLVLTAVVLPTPPAPLPPAPAQRSEPAWPREPDADDDPRP